MSKSFLNRVKENPVPAAFGVAIVFGVAAFLIWYFVFREKNGQAGPGAATGVVPELTVSGMKTVKSVETSEYTPVRYEYALGDFRGDNIDYDITITTKGGFEENNISKLVINRRKTNAVGDILVTKIIRPVNNYKEYKKSFLGSDLKTDAVAATGGDNYFEVIGYVVDKNGGETQYGTSPLASTTIAIPVEDLNYTLPDTLSTEFDWTINSGGTSFGVSQGTLERTKYRIAFDPRPVSLIPVTGGGYKFKFDDGSFFTVDGKNEFKLDKFGDEYRLFNGTEIVTRTLGDGNVILKEPNLMSPAEAAAAMTAITIFTPSTTPVTTVYCDTQGDREQCGTGNRQGCEWNESTGTCVPATTTTTTTTAAATTTTTAAATTTAAVQCPSGWSANSQGKCVDYDGCEYPLMFNDGSCE